MQTQTFLVKSDKWEKVPSIFEGLESQPNRPLKEFKCILKNEKDIANAKKAGIPLLFVESEQSLVWHYPMKFPTTIILPREYLSVVKTNFPIHTFQSLRPFVDNSVYPKIEDFILFVLSFDSIAARILIERNKDIISFDYLTARIFEECLEKKASQIYMEDFCAFPSIKCEKLPRQQLSRQSNKNFVRALL